MITIFNRSLTSDETVATTKSPETILATKTLDLLAKGKDIAAKYSTCLEYKLIWEIFMEWGDIEYEQYLLTKQQRLVGKQVLVRNN